MRPSDSQCDNIFFLLIRSRLLWSPGLDNVELAYTLWALRAAMMNDINDPISIVFSDSVWSDKIVIVSLSSLSEIWILPAAESGEDFITFPRCHHCWFFFLHHHLLLRGTYIINNVKHLAIFYWTHIHHVIWLVWDEEKLSEENPRIMESFFHDFIVIQLDGEEWSNSIELWMNRALIFHVETYRTHSIIDISIKISNHRSSQLTGEILFRKRVHRSRTGRERTHAENLREQLDNGFAHLHLQKCHQFSFWQEGERRWIVQHSPRQLMCGCK